MGRLLDRAYLVPLALVLLHAALVPLRVNHDCSQFLLAGRVIAEGGRPFVDVVDTNPPLVMLLSTVPALLERVVPLHAATIFALLVVAAATASAAALRGLLGNPALGLERDEASLVALVFAAATLSIDATLQLGQRDHLFMLALYPYAIARWIRFEGGTVAAPGAILLGAAAGLGACFRPSLALLVLALEAGPAVRRRGRGLVAPETVALAAAVVAYALYLLVLIPGEVRSEIFGRWAPLIARGYSVFDSSRGLAMLADRTFVFVVAAAAIPWVLAAAAPAEPPPIWRLARGLAALTALGAVLYALDRKEWPYRLHPAFGGASLVIALGLVLALRRLALEGPAAWRVRAAGTLLACLSLVAAWHDPPVGVASGDIRCIEVAVAIERYSREGDAVLFLTSGVTPGHPATLQTDRRLATRYLNLFPVPLLRRHPDPAAERRFIDELRADVARSDPALVFVQTGSEPGMPAGTSTARWLAERGALAPFLEGRRLAGRFGGMDLYVRARARSPLPAPAPGEAR